MRHALLRDFDVVGDRYPLAGVVGIAWALDSERAWVRDHLGGDDVRPSPHGREQDPVPVGHVRPVAPSRKRLTLGSNRNTQEVRKEGGVLVWEIQ